MRLLRKRKGIVGIEAAIVLIAFVVIAAALSYVVINMGFFATQKTKETIAEGIGESTAALQLDGTVTTKTNDTSVIEYFVFPVKLSVGKAEVDLGNSSVVVSVYLPNATLLDIYSGCASTDNTTLESVLTEVDPDTAKFLIYNGDEDAVLESKEKAFLVIHLNTNVTAGYHYLSEYETVKIEVKTGRGAALTVLRTAPGGMSQNSYVDLG